MKRTMKWALGVPAILLSLTLLGQVANEGLANGVINARKKNAALLLQYTWNCRTDIEQHGKLQDLRINLVNLGPDGKLQKTLLSDQQGALPRGLLRRAAEKNQREQHEKYLVDLAGLVDQYTLSSAGAIINFLSTAQIQPVSTPEGKTILNINGANVVVPGDSFGMTVDGRSLQPMNITLKTTYNGEPVTLSASMITTKNGLNHVQYATVSVPAKNLTIMIHNYDYVQND
jgi:hypothetical protein